MDKDAVLDLALEALEDMVNDCICRNCINQVETITAIKAALEAKDEPVALVVYRGEICYKSTDDDQSFGIWCPVNYDSKHGFADGTKFYTTPPQRTWVGLTDEECLEASLTAAQTLVTPITLSGVQIHVARVIEAKLKEKNER